MPDLDTILRDFASFIEAELPPPDVERLVSTSPRQPKDRLRWYPVVVLVAAGLTALTIGVPVLVLGVFSTGPAAEDPVTTTSTVNTTQEEWMIEQGPAALSLVEDYYSALNTGDVAEALAMVGGSAPENLPLSLQIGVEGLGATFVADCSVSESLQHIVCNETVTDNLYGPAGIALKAHVGYSASESRLTRLVGDGYDIPACAGDPRGGTATYLLDLYDWIVETHPELERNFTGRLSDGVIGIPCTPYPFLTAESASEIADIVPEFIAQSDKYPLLTP